MFIMNPPKPMRIVFEAHDIDRLVLDVAKLGTADLMRTGPQHPHLMAHPQNRNTFMSGFGRVYVEISPPYDYLDKSDNPGVV